MRPSNYVLVIATYSGAREFARLAVVLVLKVWADATDTGDGSLPSKLDA